MGLTYQYPIEEIVEDAKRRLRQQAVDSWIPQSGWLAHDDRCERDELAGVAGVRRPV
jgi:hypothetical protein